MEVHHRLFQINNDRNFDLFKDELDKAGATYKIKKLGKIGTREYLFIEFIVSENDELFRLSQSLIPKYKVSEQIRVHFDQQDFETSEWFYIMAGEYQYPMGENVDLDYTEVTYDLSNYCDKCGMGKTQNNPFRLKRDFKQRTNQFLGLHYVFGTIFVRPPAKEILNKEGFIGIDYVHPLFVGSKEPIKTVYQMKVDTTLPPGLVQAWHNGGKGYAECPFCQSKKSLYPQRDAIRFNKSIFSNSPDIVQSHEHFGSGSSANRLTLVSKRFYNIVEKYKLKGLTFTPVVLE
jgi:hypothetical protein